MNIILSNTDSAPIYEQITRQLRAKIVSGELAAGQALPSMRLLARELRISVITTKRAYEELEREGLIVTQTGRGSFVAQVSGARLREEQQAHSCLPSCCPSRLLCCGGYFFALKWPVLAAAGDWRSRVLKNVQVNNLPKPCSFAYFLI